MKYAVSVSPSAKKELDRLPKSVQDRIVRAFDALAEDPRPHGCLKLEGADNQYRIRVGDYRIVYLFHQRRRGSCARHSRSSPKGRVP